MWWTYSVLFLGWLFSGLESQMILTQPSSMSASPGVTFNIPCRMNTGYSINSERARWYQQKPGGVPRFLYHYYTSTDQGRGTGVPERFSVSPDASQNLWNLVISGVQMEDDAVYYCASWDYKLTGHTVIDFNEELR
uniref:Ig-like domain-containing protein n=1 Tax=Laticauda laticaudata TaxID=8630 RepID=A0A8C5RU17_LATLA